MRTRSEAKRDREKTHRNRLEKTPEYLIDTPNDPINEQVILAAEIVDREIRRRGTKLYPPDAFYAEEHKAIQAGLIELERKNLEYDPAVLVRIAPDVDIRILETLAEARPEVPENLEFHFDMLAWDWQRAKATRGPLSSLLECIQNPKEEPERVKALARQLADAFTGDHGQSRYLRDPKEVARAAMLALRNRVAGEAFYPFGIDGLDYYEEGAKNTRGKDIGGQRRIRPGAAPGTISMVTALSGSGKSTFTGHLVRGIRKQNRRVLFGAWEEEAPVTIELLATLDLGWSRSDILDGRSNRIDDDGQREPLNHEELVLIEERMDDLLKYVTFFDNPFQRGKTRTGRSVTNDDHLDIVQDHIAHSGCDVFFADLWQRCLVDTGPEDEKHALFRQLAIANEQRVHVGIVHQQRAKDIETRADKRPTREGIIGSGAWLDVCWLVMAPHLPAKWKRVPDNTMELYILKQRNGPWPLCIEFDWDPETGQIKNGRSIPVEARAESGDEAFAAPKGRGNRRR